MSVCVSKRVLCSVEAENGMYSNINLGLCTTSLAVTNGCVQLSTCAGLQKRKIVLLSFYIRT